MLRQDTRIRAQHALTTVVGPRSALGPGTSHIQGVGNALTGIVHTMRRGVDARIRTGPRIAAVINHYAARHPGAGRTEGIIITFTNI